MTAVAAWLRVDLRSRWRSLLVLALLVAFASGTVVTAVAGARRGASAVDRLADRTLPATAVVLPNEPGFDWDAVRALPSVEALANFVVTSYARFEDEPESVGPALGFPWAGDDITRTIERPVVLEGRLADPTRADEVTISPRFAERFDRDVGDTVKLRLYTPEQIDAYNATGTDPDSAAGPVIEARIVGVIRSPWFTDESGNDAGLVNPSPGLYATFAPNLLGERRLTSVNALVRLHGGEAALPRFKAELARVSGRADIDVWNRNEAADHARDVTGFEANGLLVFALAAGVTSVFLVGQSIARYAGASAVELHILRAVGLRPGESRLAAAIGPTLAAAIGVGLGAVAAVVASRWFPIGTAAVHEPDPGIDVDLPVIAAVVVLVPILVAVTATLAATSALRSHDRRTARTSTIADALARSGAPAPLTVGTRFALERGFGQQAVPVRPALLGAIVGVLGTLGALTFSNGVRDAVDNPERFGHTYQIGTFLGFNGQDFAPGDEVLDRVAADDDVVAVNDTRFDVVEHDGAAFEVFSYDPVGTRLPVVMTSGRLPTAPSEIALAPRTADAISAGVGDSIEVEGSKSTVMASVTGIGFVPAGPHNDYASGAWLSKDGYDAISDGFKFHIGLVTLRDGVDPAAAGARFSRDLGLAVEEIALPPEVEELRQVRALPTFLAVFLAVLALGAVGHALATAVRRRRHDLAALRAIGLTGGQTRLIVITQATVLAVVGVAVGTPAGVALGRTLWRTVADNTPVHYLPPAAALAILVVVPLALALSNLLAALPSQRAARMPLGRVLRVE